MKVVKAITLREPAASRIAAGEETIAYTGFRTGYRGEILIVADQEPWYGLALAELVDVRGISPEMSAPISRGYAWTFANVVRITRFPAAHRSGVFTAEIPEGALPSALQTSATAPAFADVTAKSGRTACARVSNSATDSHCRRRSTSSPPAGVANGETG